jgi:hypothetical protein
VVLQEVDQVAPWRLWMGDAAELSNLEVDGDCRNPCFLGCCVNCSSVVTGGLGCGLEGGQGVSGDNKSLHRGGTARGGRLLGCGEHLPRHVLGDSLDDGEDRGVKIGGLRGERDGILRGFHGSGRAGDLRKGPDNGRRRLDEGVCGGQWRLEEGVLGGQCRLGEGVRRCQIEAKGDGSCLRAAEQQGLGGPG